MPLSIVLLTKDIEGCSVLYHFGQLKYGEMPCFTGKSQRCIL